MANIRIPTDQRGNQTPASRNGDADPPRRTDLLVPPQTETPEDRTLIKMRLRRLYILRMIREFGAISRAEIGRRCSYNPQSTKRIVDELVEEGLVVEEGKIQKPVGRSPIACRLNESAAVFAGLAVGKKKVRGQLMNLAGEVVAASERPMPEGPSAEALATLVNDLHREAGDHAQSPLCGAALCLAEMEITEGMDFTRMPIPAASTDPGRLTEALSRQLGVAVLAAESVRMRAFASLWFGIGREYSSFTYLHLDEHSEMASLHRGRMIYGSMGRAGNLQALAGGETSLLAEVTGKKRPAALGQAIGAIINLLNPAAIIVSAEGGAPEPRDMERIRKVLRGNVDEEVLIRTPTVPCDLGEDGEMLGASACVLHHIFSLSYVGVEDVL